MEAKIPSVSSHRSRLARELAGRLGIVVTISVGLALALAGPGLAADELVPLVEIAPPPDVATSAPFVAPPDSTQPPAHESDSSEPTATEPPITVSVNVDGGDVDVSVRVLSPGEDADESAQPPVISEPEGPDITAAPTPASDPTDTPTGDDTSEESNTNVTVRVLSPGDNGPVGQANPLEAREAETPDTLGENAVEAVSESTIPPEDGEQYQGADSRYQSSEQFEDDSWIWLWYLSLDCDGNAASSSTETGQQSSRDWSWKWTWNWACGSPPHPPPVDSLEPAIDTDATRGVAEPAEREPASTASTGGATSGDDAAPDPWLWTWTFTFCGETVTATLPINAQTALEWAWEWIWTWTCRDEVVPGSSETTSDPPTHHPSPTPATEAAREPAANAPSAGTPGADVGGVEPFPWVSPVDLPAWVISLLPFPELGRGATIRLVPVFDPLTRTAVISTLADIAPIPLPFVVPAAPFPAADAPAAFDTPVISPRGPQSREGAAQTPATTVPVGTDGLPSRRAETHSAEPRLEKAPPPAKRHSAGRHSRGTPPVTLWPPLRPFQAAGAPGASSSFVPSTSVLGTAALVALFVLAAPGFGRRIRVAHELRPRGTYGSSIDRPG